MPNTVHCCARGDASYMHACTYREHGRQAHRPPMLLTVTVPEGLFSGDVMSVVAPDGLTYELIVPSGCKGGSSIEVDLPCDEPVGEPPPTNGGMEQVEIVVPDGVLAGQLFSVDFHGILFEIGCPDGCGPGSAIMVELPQPDSAALPPPEPPPVPSWEPSEQETDNGYKFKPGQRVELIRTGGTNEEVTSSGTSTHCTRPIARVRVPCVCAPSVSPERSAHLRAVVCGFEGVFDVCYKIKLDNGLYKEAVPEDDISADLTSDMGDLFGEW